MNIRYQEFNPSAPLLPYVDGYWLMHFDGEGKSETPTQRCLPLGMLELIFHLGDEVYEATIDGEKHKLPPCFVAGMYEKPVSWKTFFGAKLFGIRIKPECMMELFKVPVSVLFNEFADMESFFGKDINAFAERIQEAQDIGSRIQLAEQFLLKRLCNRQSERNYVIEATRLIRHAKGNISIDELSNRIYISTRQLQRGFKDNMGASPKTYMRIIRFRNAYRQVQHLRKDIKNWASLSYDFGYADQAHLIRDFRQFTGKAPSAVVNDESSFYQLTSHLGLTEQHSMY